MNTVFIWL